MSVEKKKDFVDASINSSVPTSHVKLKLSFAEVVRKKSENVKEKDSIKSNHTKINREENVSGDNMINTNYGKLSEEDLKSKNVHLNKNVNSNTISEDINQNNKEFHPREVLDLNYVKDEREILNAVNEKNEAKQYSWLKQTNSEKRNDDSMIVEKKQYKSNTNSTIGVTGGTYNQNTKVNNSKNSKSLSAIPSLAPTRRKMRPLAERILLKPDPSGRHSIEKLRVVQYNILADSYALEHLFSYVKRKYLSWEYRSMNIINELLSYDADIISLQEVDHFHDSFLPQLSRFGYVGEFYKRPGRKKDGCAIIFKKSRFTIEDKFILEFNDLASKPRRNSTSNISGNIRARFSQDDTCIGDTLPVPLKRKQSISQPQSPTQDYSPPLIKNSKTHQNLISEQNREWNDKMRFKTNNIAFGLLLKGNHGDSIWFVTTHLYWDPAKEDVKLAQARLLKERLRKLCFSDEKKQSIPIILCGDLNSTPDSSVYKLLNCEDVEHHHYEQNFGSKKLRKKEFCLRSVHSLVGEPKFTNFTQHFKGTLDYIFCSPDSIAPICSLSLPPESDLKHEIALPNSIYPSDHISMVCDLQWKVDHMNREVCPLGVKCRKLNCKNVHPQLCLYGMKCQKGRCAYVHVTPCKFGITCKSKNCNFNHFPCPFGLFPSQCNLPHCPYSHVMVCVFGQSCVRKECSYFHPSSRIMGQGLLNLQGNQSNRSEGRAIWNKGLYNNDNYQYQMNVIPNQNAFYNSMNHNQFSAPPLNNQNLMVAYVNESAVSYKQVVKPKNLSPNAAAFLPQSYYLRK